MVCSTARETVDGMSTHNDGTGQGFNPDETTRYTPGSKPPGPGWWMASDGNWYPPEAVPAPRPPQPPPPPPESSPSPGWWKASDGNWYPPGGPSVAQEPPVGSRVDSPEGGEARPVGAAVEAAERSNRSIAYTTLAGFGISFVGLLMPWARVLFLSVAGIETPDGKLVAGIVAIGGLLAVIMIASRVRRAALIPAFLLGLLATGIVGYDLANIESAIAGESFAATGAGIYVSLLGAVLAAGASFVGLVKN